MTFPHDFTGVKNEARGPIPDGTYNLRIVKAEEGLTKNGDHKVTIEYEVYDGDYKDRPVKFHNVTFFPPSSANAGIAKAFLEAIREPSDGTVEIDARRWIGKIVTAKVGHRSYEGKTFAEIKFVNKYEIDYTAAPTTKDDRIPFIASEEPPF